MPIAAILCFRFLGLSLMGPVYPLVTGPSHAGR
jgi:hypothetical protein